jgi:hypothetical protein
LEPNYKNIRLLLFVFAVGFCAFRSSDGCVFSCSLVLGKDYTPMYKPLKTETCKKCKSVIAEPKELIRIVKHGKKDGTSG